MSVQSLVAAAQQPAVDVSGVWDSYTGMVSRSRAERVRLRQELAALGDGALINAHDMFKLPEAYGTDRYPLVAMAPMLATSVIFRHDYSGSTRFTAGSKKLEIASPPLPVLPTQPQLDSPEARFVSTSSYNAYLSMSGHSGSTGVPLIPKSVAPSFMKRVAKEHWIMFDTPASAWLDRKVIPFDPYLLERVDGKRFRVLAHWDLTDKERQLMALIRP